MAIFQAYNMLLPLKQKEMYDITSDLAFYRNIGWVGGIIVYIATRSLLGARL